MPIGGIESHFYYLAKKYGKYDITFFYNSGDPKQIARLREYARTVQLKPEDKVICDNLFCCYNKDILKQAEAKKTYLVLHGDYYDMVNQGQLDRDGLPIDDRIDEYLGVSQTVCDSWEKLTGIKASLIGEPVLVEHKTKPLMLISACRLTAEKGWNRMVKLADRMNAEGIDFTWVIFTNSPQMVRKNMIFMNPRLDVASLFPAFDAYVQLSDNEGFCLSAVEALLQGVPVIGTDLPVFREIGMNEKNSILINRDMKDIPIDRIKNVKKMSFRYKAPKDYWGDYLAKTKSDYNYDDFKPRPYIATDQWERQNIIDAESREVPRKGSTLWLTPERVESIRQFEQARGITMIEEKTDV